MSDSGFLVLICSALCLSVAGWLMAARYYHRLELMLEDYSEALRIKGVVSNEIAHDIKNPLTAILCSAETLELIASHKLDVEEAKTLRYIREYGEQMLGLVSDFLDINLAEAGRLRCERQPAKLAPVVDSVVGLLRSTANKRNIELTFNNCAGAAASCVDTKHTKQMLFNLVHNAIKFSPDKAYVSVSMSEDGVYWKVDVADQGGGIEPEYLPKLFDPFSLANRSMNSAGRGTGIGLALVKHLAELNGGELGVHSELGKGSVFSIRFPKYEGELESPAISLKHPVSGRPLEGKTVLVVDADNGAREAIAGVVQALGAVVDTATAVEDALRSLVKSRYSAVMIDAPSGDGMGLALAKIIKQDLSCPETRIILLGDEAIDVALAEEFGVDSCVQKPANGRKIVDSIL